MIQEQELRETIEAVKRIETLIASIEGKLAQIAEGLRADLEDIRERDFWDEYNRYVNHEDP